MEVSGGTAIVEEYKGELDIAEGLNEYQIQQTCVNFALMQLQDLLQPEKLNKLQSTAFNEGVPIQTVLNVIGIELRDAVFRDRGLKVDQIDKHSPEKPKQKT